MRYNNYKERTENKDMLERRLLMITKINFISTRLDIVFHYLLRPIPFRNVFKLSCNFARHAILTVTTAQLPSFDLFAGIIVNILVLSNMKLIDLE